MCKFAMKRTLRGMSVFKTEKNEEGKLVSQTLNNFTKLLELLW